MDAPATPAGWHALSVDETLHALSVDRTHGLDDAEAGERLARYGPNRPAPAVHRSALSRALAQLTQPLVLVLIFAGTVTALLGEWVDASVILGVVVINAVVGFIQEGKAEQAMAALARALASEATVVRAGKVQRIDAARLVPGDIVHVAAGDRIPADVRWILARSLRCNESALTGEAVPVDKHAARLAAGAPLAERANLGFFGTTAVAGHGHGVVVATGANTQTGRISTLLMAVADVGTPLTRRMNAFAGLLLWAILGLAALTMAIGLARGQPPIEMFMAAVALAVGAIPEGLPAAMTITLAIGVARMARRRAIVRHLPSVETLGSTTVICSDKTGTLTENAMTVCELRVGGRSLGVEGQGFAPFGALRHGEDAVPVDAALGELLRAAVLCNDANLAGPDADARWSVTGDPTEGALVVLARKAGVDEHAERTRFPRVGELPFDAGRQMMATRHVVDGAPVLYLKGATERLLAASTKWLDAEGCPQALDDAARGAVEGIAESMAARGLRVLALARGTPTPQAAADDAEPDGPLLLLGLVGMVDPPRERAAAAIRECAAAGIAVKMITGDAPRTAHAIAHRLGMLTGERSGHEHVLTGRQLSALDDDALVAVAARTQVFARVEPEQKLRLVRALQAGGEIVAMTGDGVNDAPALKQADIGIAMGMAGTEVAKEAADMVLTDDNFATIEAAVEEGRGIYDNLVKFITWTLPTNFGEGLVILAAIAAGVALPILPVQILWINMTTAVLLGLPLAFEPAEPAIMRRPPRPPSQPVLDRVLIERIVLVGLLMLIASFGLFERSLADGRSLEEARTLAMNVFVAIEAAYLLSCRALGASLLRVPAWSNPWIWWGIALQLALQLLMTYAPWMHVAFRTAPLDAAAWLEIALAAVVALVVVETHKAWRASSAVPPPL